MPFELFLGHRRERHRMALISIQRAHVLVLNPAAYKLLGEYRHIQLLYDAERRYLGIRGAQESDAAAYHLTKHVSNGTYTTGIRAILDYYNLDVANVYGVYPAHQEGPILYINLNQRPARRREAKDKARAMARDDPAAY